MAAPQATRPSANPAQRAEELRRLLNRAAYAYYVLDAPEMEDAVYDRDRRYTYTVTATRGDAPRIPGNGNATLEVQATDRTPPAAPSGVTVEALGAGVAPKVVLQSTHIKALEVVDLQDLMAHAHTSTRT